MVRALVIGAESPGFKTQLVHGISQKLSLFTQQSMGTWLFSEVGAVRKRRGAHSNYTDAWYELPL